MSSIGPQLSPLTPAQLQAAYPGNFDQLLGRAKKSVDFTSREAYTLGTLGTESNIFSLATIAISQTNATVQAYFVIAGRIKIPKIAVFCSAIGAAALGSASFNIVHGTGAYSQGSIPGNDNSSVPPVAYNALGQAGTNSLGGGPNNNPLYAAGGGGIASNPSVPGNAMFAADVVFNVTNFPNLTSATGTGANYAQILVPSNPDAIWSNGAVLTLRVTTPAGAGTITNLIVSMYDEPQPLQATAPGQNYPIAAFPVPGVDF
jgi:hypothetical protein